MATTAIKSHCSGCMEPFTLYPATLQVVMVLEGNGARGSKRTETRTVIAEAAETDALYEWECPVCGYAESEEK